MNSLETIIYYFIVSFSPINFEKENILQYSRDLVAVWIALSWMWIVYWGFGLILPSDKSISRPSAKITNKKIILTLLRNTFIVMAWGPVTALIPAVFPVYDWFNIIPNCPFSILFASLIKYICIVLFSDGWFYYFHKLFHSSYFYKYHRQHHEFIQSHALSGLYCGALEMFLVNNLSASIPMRLFGLGYIEMLVASVLTSLFILKGHGALQHSYSGPNWLIADWEHAHHHKKMNVNYGTSYIFDRIHGTYDGTIPK